MDTTPTLFDLTQFEQAVAAPPRKSSRSRAAKPESRSPETELQLSRRFHLGQIVKLPTGDNIAIVTSVQRRRKTLSTIWTQPLRGGYLPVGAVIPYLPSMLEILSDAPLPNLPRDILRVDSLVEGNPENRTRESGEIDSLVEGNPENRTRESKVEEYYPRGQARGDRAYYRLYWWDTAALKNRYRHIRGGNIHAAPARERAARIREAIARGLHLNEILEMC